MSLAVMGLLMLVIMASGCISVDDSLDNPYIYDKGFSKEGISFQYPSNWKESDYPGTLVELQSDDGAVSVTIQKIGLINETNSIQEFINQNKQDMINSKTIILNETSFNINGATVYEMITTINNTVIGNGQKDLFVITGKDQNVYLIQFSTPDSNSFDSHLPEFNRVISTIEIV